MGAVLHTLNIRLSREQIAFIANQAEDRVVLVDMSLVPLLAAVLPEMTTVQHRDRRRRGRRRRAHRLGQDA